MLRSAFRIALLFSCVALLVNGFSLGKTASSLGFVMSSKSAHQRSFSSTCLFAEEGETPEAEEKAEDGDSGTDILNSPAFLTRKIDVLKSDIEQADKDIEAVNEVVAAGKEEWGSQLDDLQKEFSMIQERMSKQNKAGDVDATIAVVRSMLGVLDNFDRGFGAVTAETDAEKEIEEHYRTVYNMVTDTFAVLGVTEVETVGKEFDYEVHQAVMQRASEDYEEGIVCEELQRGYVIGDKLIRAAMVSVAA